MIPYLEIPTAVIAKLSRSHCIHPRSTIIAHVKCENNIELATHRRIYRDLSIHINLPVSAL